MNSLVVLSDDNFLLYAMHHYQVPSCPTLEEFENDLKTILYIKKNIGKNVVNIRLVLNHLIILYNCFGDAATNMLFFKIDKSSWNKLITFLIYINRMPEEVVEHGIKTTDFVLDENIIKELRKI